MDFEKAQQYYQWVKKKWSTQDDATKHQMLVQLKELSTLLGWALGRHCPHRLYQVGRCGRGEMSHRRRRPDEAAGQSGDHVEVGAANRCNVRYGTTVPDRTNMLSIFTIVKPSLTQPAMSDLRAANTSHAAP